MALFSITHVLNKSGDVVVLLQCNTHWSHVWYCYTLITCVITQRSWSLPLFIQIHSISIWSHVSKHIEFDSFNFHHNFKTCTSCTEQNWSPKLSSLWSDQIVVNSFTTLREAWNQVATLRWDKSEATHYKKWNMTKLLILSWPTNVQRISKGNGR